ncbi:uncharacterized protein LOC110099833 [Dendrobium catenatum]|uniref:uncharacterized protein LOC110099833 n=1 Tax=Dendrobium catenatum TaxID=906689 RepID=UPI00109F10EA|nr:uncharacterized protein LOC110099833 [Dendrobium catenatum]
MKQPAGFTDSQFPNHICLLKKAIYGLKQAPRQWLSTFSSYLHQYGFHTSSADPSLLMFQHNSDQIYILIYVDDILITGNSPNAIDKLLAALQNQFSIQNLGRLHHFLGLTVTYTPNGLHLDQSMYAATLLRRAAMENCKPLLTPLPTKFVTHSTSEIPYDNLEHYRQLTGALQYLTITRPDLSYAVNFLCQHMHTPLQLHYKLLKRVLRYVKGTLSLGLPITPSNLELQGFADSDWATDPITRRSVTGYCAFLGTTLISWIVKKQTFVARSSTEAEYRALSTAACDLIRLRRLLSKFQVQSVEPTILYCDNISALALANNPVFHARTKNIEIDFHFIRDCIRNRHLEVQHICSTEQPADLFTKALSAQRHLYLCNKLTLQTATVSLRGADKES